MKRLAIILTMFIVSGCAPDYSELAGCLSEKRVKMYGAYWCPHCASQKEMFGSSFEKIEYVECSLPNREGQTQFCQEQKIESYPTWEFPDGTRVSGEQTAQSLAVKSGCQLPK